MADNYLEKRMEEYRAGKLASKGGKSYMLRQRKAGEFVLAFPPMSVLVLCEDAALAGRVCGCFRKADFQVAFCMADRREGTRIAQSAGCRFYPVATSDAGRLDGVVDDLTERWGAVDVVADLRGLSDEELGDSAGDVASLLLLHSHPDFGLIASTELNL